MRAEVLAFCRKNALFSPGERVCCAVSGGADSVALLTVLHELSGELELRLTAAHFNHCLRGEESERDERFVRALCGRLNVPLTVGRGDVAALTARSGLSTETAARRLRYAFFDTLDSDRIATAHTAGDNAETVLLQLLRGAGLRGLSGIPAARGRFVRPLLGVTRAQLETYLRERGETWVVDSTNLDDACARNRLRHRVMPELERQSPGFAARLTPRCAVLREEDAFLDVQAAALLRPKAEGWAVAPILNAPPVLQRRALRQVLATVYPQDVSLAHIEALRALLANPSPSARLTLPGGFLAERRYDRFLLTRFEVRRFSPQVLLLPGAVALESGWTVQCKFEEKPEKIRNSPFLFSLSCAMIREKTVLLRPRRAGDRLMLANGSHATVKKLFIDRKLPRALRDALPVFECGGVVLAAAGLGASRDALPAEGQAAWIICVTEKEEIQHAQ